MGNNGYVDWVGYFAMNINTHLHKPLIYDPNNITDVKIHNKSESK